MVIPDQPRVDPFEVGKDQSNYFVHLARYKFVAHHLKKQDTILEIGCGTGYGARLLADYAADVMAYDAANDVVESSWKKYRKENLHFTSVVPDKRFDVVVSLEVIEHMPESEAPAFLEMLKAHSKGLVFLSTPRFYAERSENRKRQHPKEYTFEEFKTLLGSKFRHVFVFSQNDALISVQNPAMAWNFVAICVI